MAGIGRTLSIAAIPRTQLSIFWFLLLAPLAACSAANLQSEGKSLEADEDSWLGAGQTVKRDLKVGKRNRFYELYLPSSYRSNSATPVVMVWHGGGGYPASVARQSGMNKLADEHGFLVVYPAGSGVFKTKLLTFNAGACCGYASRRNVDDVAYALALLDDLAKDYAIDRKRVYSTGMSNGAMMSYRLACELGDRIAAIGPVSGVLGVTCSKPGRPVPVIHFHGKADQNSPYLGGRGAHSVSGVDFQSALETVRIFVERNGCPEQPTSTRTRGKATELRYSPCRDNAEVVFWSIEDGGHTWPDGDWASRLEGRVVGPINRDISASDIMWQFFRKHSMK